MSSKNLTLSPGMEPDLPKGEAYSMAITEGYFLSIKNMTYSLCSGRNFA
jgi:hypothetical protein